MKKERGCYGGWEFFYQGWKSSKNNVARHGATPDNLFPKERSSSLDGDVLLNLGMNAERLKDKQNLPDALFFFQLLLPIGDPSVSEVEDPRKPFYTEVNHFTNLYRCQQKIGFTYGHNVNETVVAEIVRWMAGALSC